MTRLPFSVWWLVLFLPVVSAKKSRAPQLQSLVQSVQLSLQAESDKDVAAYDKVACWCQNQLVEQHSLKEKMQQQHDVLAHDIDEETARTARIDLELGSHEEELESSVNTLSQANSLRRGEAEKYDETEKTHMQSINQLDQALGALKRNDASEFTLSLVQTAGLRHKRAGAAEGLLARLNTQLRGRARNSPAVVRGVIQQMKSMFKEDLDDLRQSETAAKQRHEGITAAKTEEISSLKKQILEKKQRTATAKVVLAHKKEFLDRSEKLLDINMQLVGVLKIACQRNDESHQQRKEAQQAALVALSAAQADLSGMELLGVGAAASARHLDQVSNDGVKLVCSAAREIVEDKSWRARLQAACAKAQSGGAGALQDAADEVESIEDDIKSALENAQNKREQCERSIHDAQSDALVKEKQASAEASFIGSEQASTVADIEDADAQVAHAKQAKSDLFKLRAAQHHGIQDMQLALTHNAELLQKASAAGGNSPAVAKIEEAQKQSETLISMAAKFDKDAGQDTQKISALFDSAQLAAGKVLIPLRLMHADSEEAAVAIDEESASESNLSQPQCDVAGLSARVQVLSGHVQRLGTAATSLSMDALR